MSRLTGVFAEARAQKRCALVPYITAGDPSLEASYGIALELSNAGAAVIELGIPFSDPVADGPVIQAASERALARGTSVANVLKLAARIREQSEVGLLLFSYFNPIFKYGLEAFARDAAAAGADGVLVTDMIPEESGTYARTMQAAGLDTVFLAAPTSTDTRLQAIADASRGFIYAVSRMGVTGANDQVAPGAEELVGRLRKFTQLPIALGFGLSRPEQIQQVAHYADGAVVGTALVRIIHEAGERNAAAAAGNFLRNLCT